MDMNGNYFGFGVVNFKGETFTLLAQPELSGKQMPDWYTDEGYSHFTAEATDVFGNKYIVEWIRILLYENGEPIEDLSDSVLDWENPDSVERLS